MAFVKFVGLVSALLLPSLCHDDAFVLQFRVFACKGFRWQSRFLFRGGVLDTHTSPDRAICVQPPKHSPSKSPLLIDLVFLSPPPSHATWERVIGNSNRVLLFG